MSTLPAELVNALVVGVLHGSVYALVALGIVLVYRGSGVFNFAQAEFGTTALFAAYAAHVVWGWAYFTAIGFGLVVAVAMGLLTERLVIRPLRNASKVTLLVGTAGVALAAIGVQFWQFNETLIMVMPPIDDAAFSIPTGARVSVQELVTVLVLAVAAFALWLFFRSPTGLAVQAAQQEAVASELVGISVRRISMLTWGIAAFLGGLAGVLAGPFTTFTAGWFTLGGGAVLLPGFMAAILAGMRSMPGAVLGGLTIGVVKQLGFLSVLSAHVPGAPAALLLAFLLAALLLFPKGLFVGKESYA